MRIITDAAHEKEMPVVAHALTNAETVKALEAGVDRLTYLFIDPIYDQVIKAFKKNNAFLIPAIVVSASVSSE